MGLIQNIRFSVGNRQIFGKVLKKAPKGAFFNMSSASYHLGFYRSIHKELFLSDSHSRTFINLLLEGEYKGLSAAPLAKI